MERRKFTRPTIRSSVSWQREMKPEQLQIARLKREVIKLKAERGILKRAAAYFAKESL